jgi:ABC-2 type transport system permease protein
MRGVLPGWWQVCKRELAGYFRTPVGWVFLIIFLVLAGIFTFQYGKFFERGQANLDAFFTFHPWLYLFLVPAVAMRLWAEERRQGTIELLLTLPVSPAGAVAGKFLAAWIFIAIALGLTFPIWISVAKLGDPDHGAIITAYVGSLLMAGGFLAVGSAVSAATKSQVIAFIVTVVICFVLLMAGDESVLNFVKGWAAEPIADAVSSLSFLTRFKDLSRGVIDARDALYFLSLIAACLTITVMIVEARKGE